MFFILKLLLVPSLIALVSFAGRRWGHQVSGILTALPIVAGPVLLFLSLEQGPTFAAAASARSLVGMFPLITFCLIYCLSAKNHAWPLTIATAFASYGVVCWSLLQFSNPPLVPLLLVNYGLLYVVQKYFPKSTHIRKPGTITNTEILFRMGAAEILVLVITGLAAVSGPNWSGILAPFPIACSTLSIFTQRVHGYEALIGLMRGFFAGFWSFSTFLFSYALLLQHAPLFLAFTGAIAVSIAAHTVMLYRMSQRVADGS